MTMDVDDHQPSSAAAAPVAQPLNVDADPSIFLASLPEPLRGHALLTLSPAEGGEGDKDTITSYIF